MADVAANGWYAGVCACGGEHAALKELAAEVITLRALVMSLGDRCVGLVEMVTAKAMRHEAATPDNAPWSCPCCGKGNCDGYCTVDNWCGEESDRGIR